MARIAIAEDDARYRAMLADTLRWLGGHELVGLFSGGRTALGVLEQRVAEGRADAWDLLVTDLEMPDLHGIKLTQAAKALAPELPVLVLTAFEDAPLVCDAIAAGADGYVCKSASPEELVDYVQVVLRGGSSLSPGVARLVLGRLRQSLPAPAAAPARARPALTPREQDVLQGLVAGQSYKEIAAAHEVSIDTVRTHIRGLYRKLQVRSATGAVALAMQEGLVR